MDAKNTPIQHVIVGIFTLALVSVFKFLLETSWATSFGRVSFVLLFFIMVIGPIMKIKKPKSVHSLLVAPWSWRGELGIWFTLAALTHFIILVAERSFSNLIKMGGGGFGLANLLGLIALFLALFLTATSFRKVIIFLGVESWKWLHSFTYVVFYMASAHFMYFQFFSTHGEVGPDWFGYIAVVMAVVVIVLQVFAFVTTVTKQRKEFD